MGLRGSSFWIHASRVRNSLGDHCWIYERRVENSGTSFGVHAGQAGADCQVGAAGWVATAHQVGAAGQAEATRL